MVGVVGGERDELVADGHGARRDSGAGWAADGVFEVVEVSGCGCSLESAVEETLAEDYKGLSLVGGGEAIFGSGGEWGFDVGDPVKGDLLPEGEVPELFEDGVGGVGEAVVDLLLSEAFEDVGGRGSVAVGDESGG